MSSPQGNGAASASADEETPLLRDEETPLLRDADSTKPSSEQDHAAADQTVIPDEPSTQRLVITLGSIYIGIFLGALDSTIIATLSNPISSSFDSNSLLSWLASGYLIANAACQPLSGRLTDIFSRRTGLIVSNTLFCLGNLVCGLAQSEWIMIAGRVVAGMGGGGLMTIATFVASDLVPLRKRGLVQGIGNISYGTGAALGGLFGGWVNDVWGWRVAFLAQVPPCIVSAVVVSFAVTVPAKKSEKSRLSRVDFLGSATLVTTLVLLLLGLNSGGNVVPWTHSLVLVSLPLSVVSCAAFVYVELHVASEPVIPIDLLLERTVLAACLTNWFMTMVQFMVIFYVPIFFQVKGYSTTRSGVFLVPGSIGSSIGSLAVGFVMNRTGRYKSLGMAVNTSIALGTGLLCTLGLSTPDWPANIYMFFQGAGYGGMITVMLPVITSATYAFRSTGSTIGVTIASAVYQNVLRASLESKFSSFPDSAHTIKRITDSFDQLKHLPDGWRTGVLESYIAALRSVFATALGIAVLGTIAGSLVREHILHTTLSRS